MALRNHGVDPAVVQAAFDAARRFFALDPATKQRMEGYTRMEEMMREGIPGFLGCETHSVFCGLCCVRTTTAEKVAPPLQG